ncbi:3-oxoacyl-(acyl-carrier-protein) synthase 3 protein 1 [Pelotomaculum schinkii]|uniref:Beta-ketoacyl-[acyl-carrier-protein] synthase III n=1 Tax=Pelotomaculum schinkii TaxID=78350 RepID=A0A4Y7R9Y1_9FIRM|nr:3-oxoacyl-(acyl-carrier-protein) synthase 3 protein 1 [Pelotomaculum schinkii]TEB14520.1 3-oxoacyl-(acyl-carrier-protein) synthase 3 protein 1 [Pelotomaculum sp. FP]
MPREVCNAGIIGVGAYLPDRVLTNDELQKMVDTNDQWIRTRSGIKERRIASPELATSDLAVIAGERALADAGVAPEELGLIIVATNTPDTIFPATACLVQDRLGAVKAAAFDLAAGCTGFVYALATGSQFITSGTYKKVLVIGAECLSRIVNWEDRKTCVLFGDGAGAVVLSPVPAGNGILSFTLRSDGSKGQLLSVPAGGSRQPATRETVDQKLHTIHMDGQEVFKFAVRVMGKAALEVLAAAGLNRSDIDYFIPHQANIRIIESAAKRLNLSMDKVLVNLDRYGNTSTASIPLALTEAVQDGRIKQGDHIVMVGFGAGLTWGATVIKWGSPA